MALFPSRRRQEQVTEPLHWSPTRKNSLNTQIRQELDHLRSQNPDLKLVVTADGEWGNWTFSKSLNPDVEVLDFWHAIEKRKVAADAAFGSDEKASTNGLRPSAIFFATIPRVSTK